MKFTDIINKLKKNKEEEIIETPVILTSEVTPINTSSDKIDTNKSNEVLNKSVNVNQYPLYPLHIKSLYYPINDYKYKKVQLTLFDQRKCFREEKVKLQKISNGIDIYIKYLNKISKLAPLVKSVDISRYPQLIGIEEVIPILRNELSLYISEYKKAASIANKATFSARVGLQGENAVDKELDLYRDKLINLSNIRLELEDTTVESDNIVISENGVFCIEVKNYGIANKGGKIIVTKDGFWHRYNAEGEEIEISNITSQIYRHIGITQRFVNDRLREEYGDIPYVDFYPVIVFSNNSLGIENYSDVPILRLSNLYHHIATFNSNGPDNKYWKTICDILNDNNKGSKPYPVQLRADKLIENYKKLYFKLKIMREIEKKYNLEKIFQKEAFNNNRRFLSMLERYKELHVEKGRNIQHIEIITLQALLDELHMRGATDRGVYLSMILNSFDVISLNELDSHEYEFIYKCLNAELRNR